MSIYVKEKCVSGMEQVVKNKSSTCKKIPPGMQQVSQWGRRAGCMPESTGKKGAEEGAAVLSLRLRFTPFLS